MIREFKNCDIKSINTLLSEFDFVVKEENLNNNYFKILVYDEEYIKGIIIYDLYYERIEIEYIIVDKEYRRQNIATKLLRELEKINNIENITLEVRESNKSAISFYEKNGYKKVAIRKNYYKEEDGYLMMKKLGE